MSQAPMQPAAWRDPLPAAVATTFWGALGPEDRQALDTAGNRRPYAAGAVICQEGIVSTQIFLIYRGRCEVFRDLGGHRTVLTRRGPGDIIGEMSAVDRRPASATVSTIDRSVLLVIGAARFTTLCQTRPGMAWQLLQMMVARLRSSDTHRAGYWADVPQRTIMCLLELAEADQHVRGHGPAILRLTQQDLADMVSSSLVSVTRALTELRRLGAVSTARGRITVHVDRLRALATSQS